MDTQAVAIDYGTEGTARRARVWPAVALVAAYWVTHLLLAFTDQPLFRVFMGMLISTGLLLLGFLAWWAFDKRGRLGERRAPFLAWLIAGIVVGAITFKSISIMALILIAMPWVFTAWAAWLLLSRGLPQPTRKRGLVLVITLTWAFFTLFQMKGLSGTGDMVLGWRWGKTAEERYLAQLAQQKGGKISATTAPVELTTADWPGFRGPQRDGVVRNLTIATDWQASPPKQLWKQRVGPGWSSMCVVGGRLYTQEGRGDVEAVVCADADTGAPIWAHEEGARFEEPMAGAGPRATPTFANDKIYALTARGLLLCLDARDGHKLWEQDVAANSGAPLPIWGFCASPLVSGNHVIVFAEPKGVLAFDANDGKAAWAAPGAGKVTYGSVQEATVAGESLLLVWSDKGLVAMDPPTGAVRWDREVGSPSGMPRSLQPHPIDGAILVASEGDSGAARVDVTRDGANWRTNQAWTTTQYRPSFTDFVVKGDYLYGVANGQMTCVDLRDGKRKWHKGRYGAAQIVLLDDQALILVLCESGEVALVAAKPDGLQEMGRIPAIEGKTWNHPAVARGKLYVRNGAEIACFELKK
jgi:outer membrane protein assembly factor BamB